MVMRDSIDATLIPQGTPVVAGYGDGIYNWSPSWRDGSNWWDLFPTSTKLVIVVSAAHQGDILDVETGDASPTDVPGWAKRFHRLGRRKPTIYCNRSTWPAVESALQAAGMSPSQVDWWAATLDGTQHVDGAVAVQYVDTGAYDESVILDSSWAGQEVIEVLDANDPIVVEIRQTLQNIGAAVQRIENWADAGPQNAMQAVHDQIQAVQTELTILKGEVETSGQVDLASAIARIEIALQGAGKSLGNA